MSLPRLRWLFAGSAALNLFMAGLAVATLSGPGSRAGDRPSHARHAFHARAAAPVSIDAAGVVMLPALRVEG